MSPQQSDVPGPIGLLSIQAGGGFLALIPIVTLNSFANLDLWLYAGLVIGACLNIAGSVFLLWAYQQQRSFIVRLKPLTLCRLVIFGDTIMLGLLVWGTGGSEKSIFTAQFAAVVPMAVLIRDTPVIKWSYAAAFLLMFLLGLVQPLTAFHQYTPEELFKNPDKLIWFLVFFFLFTLFPVVYSIMAEKAQPAPGSGSVGAKVP
jgi:hypothetical protein